MVYALLALFAAIVIAVFFVASWWGGLVALIILAAVFVYIVIARRENPSVGSIERGRRQEPTGRVRSGSGGAETANQRQGQE